jgi:hypothetical protein
MRTTKYGKAALVVVSWTPFLHQQAVCPDWCREQTMSSRSVVDANKMVHAIPWLTSNIAAAWVIFYAAMKLLSDVHSPIRV